MDLKMFLHQVFIPLSHKPSECPGERRRDCRHFLTSRGASLLHSFPKGSGLLWLPCTTLLLSTVQLLRQKP